MKKRTLGIAVLSIVGMAVVATPPPAKAAGWDYDLALYLFAAGMDGRTVVRGREADVDVSFSDILEDLEMAATAHFEANKRESRWGWFADVFWLSLGRNLDRP